MNANDPLSISWTLGLTIWRSGLAAMLAAAGSLGEAWQQATMPLLASRLPNSAGTARTLARSLSLMQRAAGSGGRGFAPVHRTVTVNARRLKRRRD